MRRWAYAGLVVALAAGMATLPAGAQSGAVETRTTLATKSIEAGGRAVTAYSATVLGEDGAPAKGVVLLTENGKTLAGAALNSSGVAEIRYDGLPAGAHSMRAVYSGDSVHAASESEAAPVRADIAADSFALSISPASVTVPAPGDAETVVATITRGSSFTGFVSMSCAGPPVSAGSATDNAMPVGVTCTFTPENLQITSLAPTFTSTFSVQTTAAAGAGASNRAPQGSSPAPLALAVLLPGMLGLGWLGRKRKILGRAALLAAMGVIAVLGTSACNARYKYLNHPPTYNGGTPAGDYTLTIWAQTSNGVSASEQFLTMPLTVK